MKYMTVNKNAESFYVESDTMVRLVKPKLYKTLWIFGGSLVLNHLPTGKNGFAINRRTQNLCGGGQQTTRTISFGIKLPNGYHLSYCRNNIACQM